MRVVILAACIALSCSSFLPAPASPSARPARLLGSAKARFAQGEMRTALELTREAEREAVGFDDVEAELAAALARAGMYRWLAEEDSARSLALRVVDGARTGEFPCLEAEAAMIIRSVASHDSTAAESGLEGRVCAHAAVRARTRFARARSALAIKDVTTAARYLGRPRRIPKSARVEITQEWRFLMAWLRSEQDRHRDAIKLATQVLRKDRAAGVKTAIVDDLLLLARLYRAAGDEAAAADAGDRAIRVLESMHPQNLVAKRLAQARTLRSAARN